MNRISTRAALIALLFFATGASGLIYQVVWQRYFLNTFGATIYSVSAVLSAFMGGLALGSLIFGRLADRLRKPLAVYGFIEIAVALAALAVPFLLQGMEPLFSRAYQAFGSQFLVYSLVRFVFVFIILLIPTTLMGATLPILSSYLSRHESSRAGGRVGLLYAVNTFGAVAGAFLCGFYFIRWWGVSHTVYLAASLNAIAGAISLLLQQLSSPLEPLSPAVSRKPEAAAVPAYSLVMFTYAISGFAALSLEVVWSRALVFTFENLKNTTYSFTAMLTTFLVGITLGSAVMTPLANRLRHPLRVFSLLQILVGFLSLLSFFILYYLAGSFGNDWLMELDKRPGDIRWAAAITLVFTKSVLVVGPPTFCMGLAFPLAVRIVSSGTGVGASVGRLYAINTLGAIIGAASTGFFLLPALGIANIIILMAALQMVAGAALLWKDSTGDRSRRAVWIALATAALAIGIVRTPRPAVFQRVSAIDRLISYEEGPLATVAVVENSLGYRTITVDNVGVAGTDPMLLTDQKSLAHVPMLLLENPRSALTVGFGSGGASYSYTLYPELEQVDCVEITPTVPRQAPYLQDSNKGILIRNSAALSGEQRYIGGQPFVTSVRQPGALTPVENNKLGPDWFKSDKRYNLILDDARSYLHFTKQRYSIIATDCTDLRYKSNANLYDLQYFRLCRDRITDDGMVVVWMPLAGLDDAAMKVALRTFYEVFPQMEVFFMNNQPTHYVLLIGTKDKLTVNPDTMVRRLQIPEVKADLAEIHLDSPEKILSCYVTGREKMKAYLQASPVQALNTEDFPYLEFESPRYGYSDNPILDNLDELYKFGVSAQELVSEPEKHTSFTANLQKYLDAAPYVINGHRDYREVHIEEANANYMRALEINPQDTSVQDLLNFEEIQRKIKGQVSPVWARLVLGKAYLAQKRESEAVSSLIDLAKAPVIPPDAKRMAQWREGVNLLADIYERNGKPHQAAEYRKLAGSAAN